MGTERRWGILNSISVSSAHDMQFERNKLTLGRVFWARRLIWLSAPPSTANEAEAFSGGCLISIEERSGYGWCNIWYKRNVWRWEGAGAAVAVAVEGADAGRVGSAASVH